MRHLIAQPSLLLLIGLLLLGPRGMADEPAAKRPSAAKQDAPEKQTHKKQRQRKRNTKKDKQKERQAQLEQLIKDAEKVELFDAMATNQIDVLVVARNFSLITLSLRNKTKAPLLVQAPEVFAAIPTQKLRADQIARQARQAAERFGQQPNGYRGRFNPGRGQRYGRVSQIPQGLGGSFYTSDPGQRFADPPETKSQSLDSSKVGMESTKELARWLLLPGKVVTQPIPCFCLEFGKPDPSPRIPYQLRPLEDLTRIPAVREVLIRFGRRECTQRIAQLAAWHVANKTPWQTLAQVPLPRNAAGGGRKFSLRELQAARLLTESLPSARNGMPNGLNRGG